jgi:hypothetical protein
MSEALTGFDVRITPYEDAEYWPSTAQCESTIYAAATAIFLPLPAFRAKFSS